MLALKIIYTAVVVELIRIYANADIYNERLAATFTLDTFRESLGEDSVHRI